MKKCSVFIATSLDGFISRADGSIDWLNEANDLVPKGEDIGYEHFISGVDALVMGRNTFEQVLSFGEWPYGTTPVVVLSKQLDSLPDTLPPTVSLTDEEPQALVQRLSSEGLTHLYIDGGLTIQSFIVANLIDEITITIIPILLGEGKPLFGPQPTDVKLELLESKFFKFGFVQSKYRIIKNEQQKKDHSKKSFTYSSMNISRASQGDGSEDSKRDLLCSKAWLISTQQG